MQFNNVSTTIAAIDRQSSFGKRFYVNASTGKTIDLDLLLEKAKESIPLTALYWDSEGRGLQLWKTKKYGLIGAVFSSEGDLRILSGDKICSPLTALQSPSDLLNCLDQAKSRNWELAYDANKIALTIWPQIRAAGGNVRDIRINGSPLRYTSEAELVSQLERHGYQRRSENVFEHPTRGTAHLDREGQTNHSKAEGYKGTHVDFRMNPNKVKQHRESREKFHNDLRTNRRNELDQQVKDGKLTKREADNAYHNYDKKLTAQQAQHDSYRAKWRFAYGQERPKDPPGNKSGSGNPPQPKDPATKNFEQRVQQARLTDSYNSTHSRNPIPAKGATGGEIGGVACSTAYIEGIFDSPEALFNNEFYFCMPGMPDGKMPFTDVELRQVMRELAIGIYVHSTVPFFSLHFNQDADLYPIIHPAYENTLVGRVISLLDYFMKGYLNGGIFTEQFIDDWHKNPDWNQKGGQALQNLIDFTEYCQKTMSGKDQKYQSLRMKQSELEVLHKDKFAKLAQALGIIPTDSKILTDYSGFSNSFRIIAKQNSIKREGNLFLIDADFDVLYTINPSPEYKAAMEEHMRKHGTLPQSYVIMEEAYKEFCNSIHDHMVQIPICRNYFAMLGVINFFAGYFSTLKAHRKIPVLPPLEIDNAKGCPPLFPHLPTSSVVIEELKFNPQQFLEEVILKNFGKFQSYFLQFYKDQLNSVESEALKERQELINLLSEGLAANILKMSDSKMRRLIEKQFKESEHLQKQIDKSATHYIADVEKDLLKHIESFPSTFTTLIPSFFPNAQISNVIKTVISSKHDKLLNYLDTLHKNVILSVNDSTYKERNSLVTSTSSALERAIARISNADDLANTVFDHVEKMFNTIASKTSLEFVKIYPKQYKDETQTFGQIPFTATRIKSEMHADEIEKGKKVVGGCGMKLQKQLSQASRVAAHILRTNWTKFQKMAPETLTEVAYGDGKTKGVAFRVVTEDVPAWLFDRFEWMESLLLVPKNANVEQIQERLLIQEAMAANKTDEFDKLIISSKDLLVHNIDGQRSLLHIAASQKDPYYATALIKRGLSVLSTDSRGYAPIHYAAMNGAIETLKVFLNHDRTKQMVNVQSKNKTSALTVAIQHGQKEIIRFLFDQGALPGMSPDGYSTLHCALHFGDLEIINELLNHKISVAPLINVISEEGGTPLMLACELDSPDLVQRMITLGADPKIARKDGVTALEIAVTRGCKPVIEVLLKHTAPSSYAIETAAKHSSLDILALLIKTPGFYLHKNSYSDTALHTAIRFGNFEGAAAIINGCSQMAYLTAANAGKETPFSLAAAMGGWDLIIELRRRKAVDAKAIAANMNSLLRAEYHPELKSLLEECIHNSMDIQPYALVAAQAGNHQALTFIFEPNMKLGTIEGPNKWRVPHYLAKCDGLVLFRRMILREGNFLQPLKEEGGKTLAYIAASHGSSRVLRFTLEQMNKANTPLEGHFRDRHLFYGVVEAANLDCVQIFFEVYKKAKADLVNIPLDSQGTCAVHIAAKVCSLQLLKLLIREGANIKALDKSGENTLTHALRAGSDAIVDYLLKEYEDELVAPQAIYLTASQKNSAYYKKIIQSHKGREYLSQALFLAILRHDTEAFMRLYNDGAPINFADKNGMTPFLLAASTGQTAILNTLLKDRALQQSLINGNTALHEAARNGHVHCVRTLLDAGLKNEKNQAQKTPLELSNDNAWLKALFNDRAKYLRIVDDFFSALKNFSKTTEASVISKIQGLPLNLAIEIEQKGQSIWGTPLQLLLRMHKNAVSTKALKPLLDNSQLDVNVTDSNGNSLAQLLLMAEIDPAHIPRIDWKRVNHRQETLLHTAAKCSEEILQSSLKILDNLKLLPLLINSRDDQGRTPLFNALARNHEINASLLIDAGSDLNIYTHQLVTPLIQALSPPPSLAILKKLLAKGANPNQSGTPARIFPLNLSLGFESDEITRTLIVYGANCRGSASSNISFMHAVAAAGKTHLLSLFAAKGLSLEERDNNGLLPIHLATSQGQIETVKAILSKHKEMLNAPVEKHETGVEDLPMGDEEEAKKYLQGATPIHFAALHNEFDALQYLLKQNADTEVQTTYKTNALTYAARSGSKTTVEQFTPFKISRNPQALCTALGNAICQDNLDTVIYFYQRGVPINSEIFHGFTGLQLASQQGSLLTTQWLLLNGADAFFVSPLGKDSLQLAAENDSFAQFSLILEFVEPDLDELRGHQETLLHASARAGKLAHVMHLIKNLARINVKDSKGNLPIHNAVQNGRTDIANLLLACGADSYAKAINNKSLLELIPQNDKPMLKLINDFINLLPKSSKMEDSQLHLAARCGNSHAVLILCELMDVKQKNSEGSSPLHVAAEVGSPTSCLHLLKAGAEINDTDMFGRTPLHLACLSDFATAELLISAGANIKAKNKSGNSISDVLRISSVPWKEDLLKML